MSTRFGFVLLLVVALAAFGLVAGCSPAEQGQSDGSGGSASTDRQDDYNPHDVPVTEEQKAELRQETAEFTAAVTTIKQFRNEIEQETAAGIPKNPYKAHQALDKADLVLQWLPESARNSGIAKAHWETINTSANDLRTLFEQVHQNIDNKQDPNFGAVADQIDQKVAGLEQIAKGP